MAKNKPKITLGLDILDSSVRLIQLEHNETHTHLSKLGIKPLEENSAKDAKEWTHNILNLIDSCGISTRLVATYLPARGLLLTKIPLTEKSQDFKDYLIWEVEQHLLKSASNYTLDFFEVPRSSSDNGHQEILLVAAPKKDIIQRKNIIRDLNLQAGVLDLDIFALINAFEWNYRELISGTNVLINLEDSATLAVLLSEGHYVRHHHIHSLEKINFSKPSISSEDISKLATDICRDLKENLLMEQSQNKTTLLLSGEGARFSSLTDQIGQRLDAQIITANPFKNINVDPEMAAQEEFKKIAPLCMAAVGLALRR